MICQAYKISVPESDIVKVVCGCSFCRGGNQREDVTHYKLYNEMTAKEYYLNINHTDNLIEIIERK